MTLRFNFTKFYSINELQDFFDRGEVKNSSYLKYLLNQTIKIDDIYHIYISYNKSITEPQFEESNLNYLQNIVKKPNLQGIPFNIKDSFITKDFPTTFGVKGENLVSEKNSTIIKLFEENGAILLGKTSIPSYAYDVQTFNEIIGITKNPWNMDQSAGGSTGGGAVSVATGISPLAIGSDFAGSIRIPAHFCGVKGYIPSHGRKFLAGHYPDKLDKERFNFRVGQIGFLSNFFNDFDVIHNILFTKTDVSKNEFDIHSFAYSICVEDEIIPVSRDIKKCFQNVIKILESEHVDLNYTRPKDFSFKDVGKIHVELMKNTFDLKKESQMDDIHKLENLENQQKYFQEELNEFLERKFWIVPICPTPAIKHNLDHSPIKIDEKTVPYWRAMIHYTRPFNITNNPIVTIPIGKSENGLPIGVQIIGQIGTDLELLNVAKYLETRLEPLGFPKIYEFM